MTRKRRKESIAQNELSNEDRGYIREVFAEKVVLKLTKLHARTGNLGCEFAGEKYRHWTVRFVSRGNDFEIVEFEYDEEARGIDLDM